MSLTLRDQLDIIKGAAGADVNSGTLANTFDWDRITTLVLTRKNFPYTLVDTLANMKSMQKNGDAIVINKIESFKSLTPEVGTETTAETGREYNGIESPYKYEFMIKAGGMNIWKELRKLTNDTGVYDISFFDVTGARVFTETKGGVLKGFSTNRILIEQYKGKEGSTVASFRTIVQLSNDTTEMERAQYILPEQLDYMPTDLDGINNVVLSIDGVTPAVGATAIVLKVVLDDLDTFVAGLSGTSNFRITRPDGTTGVIPVASSNSGTKTYTITPSALVAGAHTIELDGIIESPMGALYRSEKLTFVVA
jgi:hypothetical protein